MLDPNREKALLRQHFGFDAFRPGQEAVISALQTHGKALAVFPTGGGKSLCYQLPALTCEGVTLVVSPLIALMKDQIDFLQARGIAAARLDSSLSAAESKDVMEGVRSGTLKLLYVAPERFNNERFLENMKRLPIALFAVDEAHCISEWGHNFRPDYLKLTETARNIGAERILALTATATPSVVEDICAGFEIPRECAIVTGFYRANLNLCITPVTSEERDALLLKRLQTRKPGSGIVYVTLQKTAERLARQLTEAGLPARAYHAGMESEERTRVQEWWMGAEGGIVVATIAFGMGIDKADVRYVYHYNLPKGLESYSQEIGRAGRDGKRSTVELFACPEDVPTLENFAYGDTPSENALHSLVKELLTAPSHRSEEEAKSEPSPFPVNAVNESGKGAGGLGELALDLYELSNQHDLRPLVLRTALTYLELLGALRQGTPFYAGYALRPLQPVEAIIAQFKGEAARLVADLFAHSKKGKTQNALWHRLNPDEMAATLGQDRKRIVRAVEVLEERGLVTVTVSEVRQRFTRSASAQDVPALTAELTRRFHRREEQEIARIQRLMELITHDGCQTNALVGYFGEMRAEPCGHCSYCVNGQAARLPSPKAQQPLPAHLDLSAFHALQAAHPNALGEPRQAARFLCGLTSPALTRAKISRHELFGAFEDRRFQEVLTWCEKEGL